MIVINFKNYKFGKSALELARTIEIYCSKAIVSVPSLDIYEISKNTSLPVFAQHVDYSEPGKSTGTIIPEILEAAGAKGSLLNHSEHPVSFNVIKKTIDRCHDIGLKIIVCVSSLAQVARIKKLQPFAMAFEDPQLIASGKSITYQKTHEVREFAELLRDSGITALCGAGISSSDDVKAALALGCDGVLVASAVADSQHPEKFLKEIAGLF